MNIEQLLTTMEDGGASDLFVCEGKPPAIRKHGDVVALGAEATTADEMSALMQTVLSAAARARFEASGDLDVGYSIGPRRFRLNLSRQQGRVALVARALPSGELSFEDLGLPPAITSLAELRRGLVLITGATGSGKSTTLAAMVNHINSTRRVHIVTIEEPIEFVHDDRLARVSQREVGTDTESFGVALRHVLRESPDVVVIGEMRDFDTMSVAISAALTGHLVLTTLHTINATQTLQRILSYYPHHLRSQASMDLSLCLQGVISQRLLPRADRAGRVLATELLRCTPPVRQLLREQRTAELVDLMRASNDADIVPFNRALVTLLEAGAISYELGAAYATHPEEFTLAARGMQTGVTAFREGDEQPGLEPDLDLRALLQQALRLGASDLHVAAGRPPIFRVGGHLRSMSTAPLSTADVRALLYAVLTVRQRSTYELEREIDFALQLDNGQRFRVNAYHQKGKMVAALRAIPTTIPEAEALRIPAQVLDLVNKPHGLLLVVGPTGAGKTTTLACLLDRVNKARACRIITVEDPIEYTHESAAATIDQREVGSDTLSFSGALKYVLRQDPDVIMIGEMRDPETMQIALAAGETGHLVFSTLHTLDATETVTRIDLVALGLTGPSVMACLQGHPDLGEVRADVDIDHGLDVVRLTARGATTRVYPCPDRGRAGAIHAITTGPATFVRELQARASALDLTLGPAGLFRGGDALAIGTEGELFDVLGLWSTPPERRDVVSPVRRAGVRIAARLVTESDLRGALHNHTTASDGVHSLLQMRDAATVLGWEYLGISEHSQSAGYAGGLGPEALLDQADAIDALNATPSAGARLLSGVESDILRHGELDYRPSILRRLDFVVASSHNRYGLAEAPATERMVAAARAPWADIIGHPTGRLLLGRRANRFDVAALLDACADTGCAVELNANPQRLDLHDRHLAMAKERGVVVSLSPDAHSTAGLRHVQYGVAIARRAGLTPDDVLNCMPLDALLAWLSARKRRAAAHDP